jgi:hypothetical protein
MIGAAILPLLGIASRTTSEKEEGLAGFFMVFADFAIIVSEGCRIRRS